MKKDTIHPLKNNTLGLPKKYDWVKHYAREYIRIPRIIAEGMVSEDIAERNENRVYGALFILCNYGKFKREYKGKKYICKAGDFIGSYRDIEAVTGIHFTIVGRVIRKLEQKGHIETQPVKGGQLFRILFYDHLTGKIPFDKPPVPPVRKPICEDVAGKNRKWYEYQKAEYAHEQGMQERLKIFPDEDPEEGGEIIQSV
ncbi:MAG: hypothetical protein LUG98_03445 [Tannerellaceae bacterium]|nr:hypothetical protein [Tannerellaceae bacterium]